MAINDPDDTIAAIATAAGEGGIAVVRISGPASLQIVDRIFKGEGPQPSKRPSHVILHGHITGESGNLDEVILLIMKAPHSYTCEDIVEIQGHGGRVVARRILRRVLEAGARLAEAGEFTKRAFLNGRIDLVQAEAVLDLVRAQSDRAAQAALEQLEGSLSLRFNQIFDELIDVAADFEATLDFEEDELSAVDIEEPVSKLHAAKQNLHELLATWDEGHLLREGAIIVISGMPNVGKSTLLNLLLGRQRSIVSPIPGTTRDTIEEPYILDGIVLRLVDTAGLRTSGCVIEEEGIRRAKAQIEKADAYLYLIDISHPLSREDADFLSSQDPERCIVVLNKTDLGIVVNQDDLKKFKIIVRSCLIRNEGLVEIREAIKTTLERNISFSSQPRAVISERHRNLLASAEQDVDQAASLVKGRLEGNMVLAASHIRDAVERIGQATGRTYHAELLQSIFSKFCIGK